METASLVVLATSRTWLTCHGSQSEGLVHWLFQVCRNLFYHSDATTLSSNWNAVQWKHDMYLSLVQKAIFSSDDWEQQPVLLTYFTTEFTNLSLKLKLVIDSDAREFHFILNRDNGSFTGQHRISLDPSKSNCLIFLMIYFHLAEFKPLINLFRSALMTSWSIFFADLNNWVSSAYVNTVHSFIA